MNFYQMNIMTPPHNHIRILYLYILGIVLREKHMMKPLIHVKFAKMEHFLLIDLANNVYNVHRMWFVKEEIILKLKWDFGDHQTHHLQYTVVIKM